MKIIKYMSILLFVTACGSAGEMFTDAGKCISQGSECHSSPVPGPTGAPGAQGPEGREGKQGVPGRDGKNGSSCTSKRVTNGAEITCTDGSHVVIFDGQDGEDGQPAPPTAYTVVELIDPCGTQPGFNEVLLRLANGQLIAHYAQGNKQFLSVIGPGNYQTTDGHNCNFTVTSSMEVTW